MAFALDEQFLIDDHVEFLPSERLTLGVDYYVDLAVHTMALGAEVPLESETVDVFAIPEPELVVDVEERSDHRMREWFFDQFGGSSWLHAAEIDVVQ